MLSHLTNLLLSGGALNEAESAQAVGALLDSSVGDSDKATFLTAQMRRGLHGGELVGFARAILPRAQQPPFTGQWKGRDIIDCCGTGGGGLNILNISTGIIFILAAAGVPVVKHGNRGVTKKSGSADVLEALGLKIDLTPGQLTDALAKLGWGFVFAPNWHSSFKAVSSVRKKLGEAGQKTIFNYLGPLLNPVRPNAQLVGVFDPGLLAVYYSALSELGCIRPCVVFGRDESQRPLGEVSHSDNIFQPDTYSFQPRPLPARPLESILVSDANHSAHLLELILQRREEGLGRRLLIENAAVAFCVQGRTNNYKDGVNLAQEMIDTDAANQLLIDSRHWAAAQK